MPAEISKKNYDKVLKIASKTHKLFNCRGITRSDFKFYKNKFYLLEINTQPGMTNLSLVPEIAQYKKISFESLVNEIVKDADIKKWKKKSYFYNNFILTTYNFKQNFQDKSLFFPIKEIEINNTFILDAVKVKDDLNYLMNRNLLFLEKDKILETIRENKIIANVEIKKIYPNKLIININEKEIIARYIKNKKNHYILMMGLLLKITIIK